MRYTGFFGVSYLGNHCFGSLWRRGGRPRRLRVHLHLHLHVPALPGHSRFADHRFPIPGAFHQGRGRLRRPGASTGAPSSDPTSVAPGPTSPPEPTDAPARAVLPAPVTMPDCGSQFRQMLVDYDGVEEFGGEVSPVSRASWSSVPTVWPRAGTLSSRPIPWSAMSRVTSLEVLFTRPIRGVLLNTSVPPRWWNWTRTLLRWVEGPRSR